MKVLCCFNGSYPNGMAMANRLKLYAKILSSKKISFLIFSEKGNAKSRSGNPFDLHYYYHWKKPSFVDSFIILRDIYSSIYRIKLFLLIFRFKDYDVLLSTGYKWPVILCFKIVCFLSGKKLIIELNEKPYSLMNLRFSFLNGIHSFILYNFVYKLIDGFIVISENLMGLANKYKKPSASVFKLPILIDGSKRVQRRPNESTPFIFHAGTLNEEKDGITDVFNAFGILKTKTDIPVKFILSNYLTDNETKAKIQSIIRKYDLKDDVIFHNFLSELELSRYYQECLAVVINKPNTLRNRHNFSTKLGECLFYKVPVIATNYGEAKKYLVHNFNALIIEETNPIQSISTALYELLNNNVDVKKITQNAHKTAVDNFDFNRHSDDFRTFLIGL